jgi:hypothetical protein
LIFGLLFFLLATTLATGIITRTAFHARSLQRTEDKLRALVIAEAGADMIAHTITSEPSVRLQRSFDRGSFAAVARREGEQVTIICLGTVHSAAGVDAVAAIRTTGRTEHGHFDQETWDVIPPGQVRE